MAPIATPSSSLAEQVLSHAQSGREVVQDFCPLAESLEWELGQEYLRERGNKAFISDASPVPFVINNDGTLSRNAAEVFFASLLEADKAGTLEEDICVLELGIGVGLFARFFLDHFKELCVTNRKGKRSAISRQLSAMAGSAIVIAFQDGVEIFVFWLKADS